MNENCLEGMRCPECGSYEPFTIHVEAEALMYDNGYKDVCNLEWDDDSYCRCKACGFTGVVMNFRNGGV